MRAPLDNWNNIKRGYRFGSKTFYSNFHLGLDLIATCGTPIYAPLSGQAVSLYGKQGGNTVHLSADSKIFRFMHLKSPGASGAVTEGSVIGYVGTTGLSTACHLHIDISKGTLQLKNYSNFIDPEVYFKGQKGEDQMTAEEQRRLLQVEVNVRALNDIVNKGSLEVIRPDVQGEFAKIYKIIDKNGKQDYNVSQNEGEALRLLTAIYNGIKNIFKKK